MKNHFLSHVLKKPIYFCRGDGVRAIFEISGFALSLWGILLQIYPVWALPEGGEIISGQGQIRRPSAREMEIHQNTDRMITNWKGFSIGGAESVEFKQPGPQSAALNRVVGGDPSVIQGRLLANGRIFLTNPSGVVFGPGARVNVGGLIASTLRISNSDFLNNNYQFQQDNSRPLSSILNQGEIYSQNGVGLLAPRVENQGTITARVGSVALSSGRAATLDFSGDGLIRFELTEPVEGQVRDVQGNWVDSGVRNSGLIRAEGGTAILSALAARGVVHRVVNNTGIVEAQSVVERNGEIILAGGPNGQVVNEGLLDVSAKDPGAQPGSVKLEGEAVGHSGTILAKGTEGTPGGKVEITSTKQTLLLANSKIDVSGRGNHSGGGEVLIWSDKGTIFLGDIQARGGLTGDGGFVEVSGKLNLAFEGTADTTAPNGNTGTLLLDPEIIIITSGSSTGTLDAIFNARGGTIPSDLFSFNSIGPITPLFAGNLVDTISETTLENLSATTNIILEANKDIFIQNLSDNLLDLKQTAGHSVTFVARSGGVDMVGSIDDEIRTQGGDIILMAGGGAIRNPDVISLAVGKLTSNGGDITLRSSTKILINGEIDTGGGDLFALPLDAKLRSSIATLSGVFAGQGIPLFVKEPSDSAPSIFTGPPAATNPPVLINADIKTQGGNVTIGATGGKVQGFIGRGPNTLVRPLTNITTDLGRSIITEGGTITIAGTQVGADLSFITAITTAIGAVSAFVAEGDLASAQLTSQLVGQLRQAAQSAEGRAKIAQRQANSAATLGRDLSADDIQEIVNAVVQGTQATFLPAFFKNAGVPGC